MKRFSHRSAAKLVVGTTIPHHDETRPNQMGATMKLLKLLQALIVAFVVVVLIFRRGTIFVP
jgi:hypothetical protein